MATIWGRDLRSSVCPPVIENGGDDPMQSAADFLPHEIETLQSRLRVFSILASHLRARQVRVFSQEDAIYHEISLVRKALGYTLGGAA